MANEIKTITAFNRDDFRKWLVKNHKKETKVTIILHKRHTGNHAPTHRELMEEAICFGWIDTVVKRLDDDRYLRNFCKRNKNSKWSENTLLCARQMINKGKMAKEGLKFYKLGLKKPTHDYGIPKNPDMPIELKKALDKDKKAKNNFENFSASIKKMIYRWILKGKRDETKNKRINLVIEKAKINSKDIFGTQEKINA